MDPNENKLTRVELEAENLALVLRVGELVAELGQRERELREVRAHKEALLSQRKTWKCSEKVRKKREANGEAVAYAERRNRRTQDRLRDLSVELQEFAERLTSPEVTA